MRKRLLTDREMVEMYLSGVDSFTVSLKANCDPAHVLAAVRLAGYQVRPRGGRKPVSRSSLPIEEAAKLYHAGLSVQEVADRAGIDRTTMANRLRAHGVEIRSLTEVAKLKARMGAKFGRPPKG